MKRAGTQRSRVLEVLAEGPCTAQEMALATGMSVKFCSAYLVALKGEGLVARQGLFKTERCTECGHSPPGRPSTIYALADAAKVAS